MHVRLYLHCGLCFHLIQTSDLYPALFGGPCCSLASHSATMVPIALIFLCLFTPADSTGAYVCLCHCDLENVPEDYAGQEFLQMHVDGYGGNRYVAIESHVSQYWFKVYALFLENPIDDIADVYVPLRAGSRHYAFIGYVSMVLLMLTLLPVFHGYDEDL